ncbi:hypothetical protein PR048_015794 [Dryococelus australis]|uniref:Uncharacterized protein n=1 Tax=Dryococelus australis TaxID=614101 RepID=A0ABQ9HHZ4_9NEOP|nr:hypothetical protein PR048_015794 [Dryococelus australis]
MKKGEGGGGWWDWIALGQEVKLFKLKDSLTAVPNITLFWETHGVSVNFKCVYTSYFKKGFIECNASRGEGTLHVEHKQMMTGFSIRRQLQHQIVKSSVKVVDQYLQLFPAFDATKRGCNKDNTATYIKCAIATKGDITRYQIPTARFRIRFGNWTRPIFRVRFHTGFRTWPITLQFQSVGRSPWLVLETICWKVQRRALSRLVEVYGGGGGAKGCNGQGPGSSVIRLVLISGCESKARDPVTWRGGSVCQRASQTRRDCVRALLSPRGLLSKSALQCCDSRRDVMTVGSRSESNTNVGKIQSDLRGAKEGGSGHVAYACGRGGGSRVVTRFRETLVPYGYLTILVTRSNATYGIDVGTQATDFMRHTVAGKGTGNRLQCGNTFEGTEAITQFETTVKRIVAEVKVKSKNSLGFSTPTGKNKERKKRIEVDDFTHGAMRWKIHEFYTVRKTVPTFKKSTRALREDGVLNCSGRNANLKEKFLIEKPEIAVWRGRYLREIREYRNAGRNIVYVDETCVHGTHSVNSCWQSSTEVGVTESTDKGPRLIIVHAGGEDDLVSNALLIFKSKQKSGDYHDDMNYQKFSTWVKQNYHNIQVNKRLTYAIVKSGIQDWLKSNNIQYPSHMSKADLLLLVKTHYSTKAFKVDKIFEDCGHDVILIWLVYGGTVEKCCDHVKNIEAEYFKNDAIVDIEIDKIIVNLDIYSDENSSGDTGPSDTEMADSFNSGSGSYVVHTDFTFQLCTVPQPRSCKCFQQGGGRNGFSADGGVAGQEYRLARGGAVMATSTCVRSYDGSAFFAELKLKHFFSSTFTFQDRCDIRKEVRPKPDLTFTTTRKTEKDVGFLHYSCLYLVSTQPGVGCAYSTLSSLASILVATWHSEISPARPNHVWGRSSCLSRWRESRAAPRGTRSCRHIQPANRRAREVSRACDLTSYSLVARWEIVFDFSDLLSALPRPCGKGVARSELRFWLQKLSMGPLLLMLKEAGVEVVDELRVKARALVRREDAVGASSGVVSIATFRVPDELQAIFSQARDENWEYDTLVKAGSPSRFSRPCIPALLHTPLASPSLALTTSMLTASRPNPFTPLQDRVQSTVRLAVAHQGGLNPRPGCSQISSQAGIVPNDASGRRVFSVISRFPRPYIPALLHSHHITHSSAFKTSILSSKMIARTQHSTCVVNAKEGRLCSQREWGPMSRIVYYVASGQQASELLREGVILAQPAINLTEAEPPLDARRLPTHVYHRLRPRVHQMLKYLPQPI